MASGCRLSAVDGAGGMHPGDPVAFWLIATCPCCTTTRARRRIRRGVAAAVVQHLLDVNFKLMFVIPLIYITSSCRHCCVLLQREACNMCNFVDRVCCFCGCSKDVTCLVTSLDDTLLVSGSKDATVKVWDVCSLQCVRTLTHKGGLSLRDI